MLTQSVPPSFLTSTVSSTGVLDTSSMAFLMYLFCVALWKYLELAILLTKRMILPEPLDLGDGGK